MKLPKEVTIKEVGPRDGLQNETKFVATADKVDWINLLSLSGLKYIEVSSFVHPKWIPSLADSLEVFKQIKRQHGVTYGALIPNEKGLERALEANIDEAAIFMSASETHNQKNINKSIDSTFPVLHNVAQAALSANKTVRGYVSTVFGCPYEGKVDTESIIHVSEKLFEMGIQELSLGDTIGVANPKQVELLLEILLKRFPADKLALHFHDTRGTALANMLTAMEMGITTFDSAAGGLGGCPYAPGASGNVATDDVVYMLEEMNIHTGVDQDKLFAATSFIQQKMDRALPSHNLQARLGAVIRS
ncbi:hydroxymethylglutaryl-CoA lyase [Longirhabdus pacifica]|uniref:hydroxymethylglutaryl-CoA lyase n=1 Tax=Longirhabdus pacifica TaxID=2305227 RepID=UPI0010089FE5|nr:hydroxymethylglutaryl-CoA lyase [Longirhabdus pacifica]